MSHKTVTHYCATATNGDPIFRLNWRPDEVKEGRLTAVVAGDHAFTPSSLYLISAFYDDDTHEPVGYFEIEGAWRNPGSYDQEVAGLFTRRYVKASRS